jgi:predicted RecB family endonuclease
VAEEHAVPQARELLDELSVLRRAMPENAPDDVFIGTDDADRIVAKAMQQAVEILEKARSESTELVDSALAKVNRSSTGPVSARRRIANRLVPLRGGDRERLRRGS